MESNEQLEQSQGEAAIIMPQQFVDTVNELISKPHTLEEAQAVLKKHLGKECHDDCGTMAANIVMLTDHLRYPKAYVLVAMALLVSSGLEAYKHQREREEN